MYSRIIDGEEYTFGVSGKLIRNVLVMYDRQTDTLWSQLLGEAVEGPLVGTKLEFLPAFQTTSPLDGKSTWIEIFPTTVSKSQTAAWLAAELQIDKRQIVSVGNDYNDLDLLEWTDCSYVVDNAPADLKNRFATVASHNNGGVAEAARRWMAEKKKVGR